MTNRKSRAGAFGAGAAGAADRVHTDAPRPPAGGNWAKSAVDTIGERLEEARRNHADMIQDHIKAIAEGALPLRIPADQIDDIVGSDRVPGNDEDEDGVESLEALTDNIRRRGLRTPLRVRPADPAWRPDPKAPHEVGEARFILQSGRRRLAACRALGVDPLAFVSFVDEGAERLDDLQERFFENVARKNLTPFEKVLSVGLIAAEVPHANLAQLAEIIGVSATMVSRGIAVCEHREALEREIDLPNSGYREIDAAVAGLRAKNREAEAETNPEAARKRDARAKARVALPFRTRALGSGEIKLAAPRSGGLTLTLTTSELDQGDMVRIADFIEKVRAEKA
jgi:ParB-like chromosome segregation protein Spo0J